MPCTGVFLTAIPIAGRMEKRSQRSGETRGIACHGGEGLFMAIFATMKLSLWSIGKPTEAYLQKAVDEFTRRLGNYYPTEWKIIAPPKNAGTLNEAALKKKEAELILGSLKQDDILICLDENGKQLTSESLAAFLEQKANDSAKQLVFLIGGAYGIDPSLLDKAHLKLSLSTLTFPHQLVRLILAEQLYRAATIIRNEKYHHR